MAVQSTSDVSLQHGFHAPMIWECFVGTIFSKFSCFKLGLMKFQNVQ